MSSVFGELYHPGELEEAVVAALRKWMPTYVKRVGEVASQPIVPPKSYTIVSEYGKWPESALPALVVESSGLTEPPEQDGEGFLSGTFGVEVASVVQGKDAIRTRQVAMKYSLAVIGSLMQHRKLSAQVWVRDFVDLAFAGAEVSDRRTRIIAPCVFTVTLQNFINVGEGPSEPIEETDEEWPIADTVETEVEKEDD